MVFEAEQSYKSKNKNSHIENSSVPVLPHRMKSQMIDAKDGGSISKMDNP